jgi:uncharacterized protein YdbL (DUF1318 family)
MKKKILWGSIGFAMLAGCAQVQVHAPKEPIKMDISMRLDVYQHVAKDADAIEDIVNGTSPKQAGSSLSELIVGTAYAAEENLSPEAKEAAYRRRDRRDELSALESQGILGESRLALVVARQPGDARAERLASEENADRMVIFNAIAKKRQSQVEDVQKVYAERLRERLPQGTPIENADGSWTKK